ncbi:phosphatidyl inositol kinase [Dissophora globulifera]|nr:phosphatidyl inositol kinase [Dissophora globulifera]
MTPAPALTPDHAEPMTSERFVSIVNSVKEAIHAGMQPSRIAQGSSGSYFCRNLDGKIVGVFKPKNEEPYGQLNPKWAKWIHRNLFPCCFGRSCLIPNLGYISEAATSLVDRRLKLNIVPSTEVVWLSSPAFHYDYLDRRAAQLQKGPKPLPDKVGSFQLFLHGFKDANLFMRDHPWPIETVVARTISGVGGGSDTDGGSVYGSISESAYGGGIHGHNLDKHGFSWTPALQLQFREQFEKMIILDYLIRNTDRGLDNWMIRYCEKEGISIVAGPPANGQKGNLLNIQQQQTQEQQHAAARRNSRVDDLIGLHSDRGSLRSSSSSLRERAGRNYTHTTPPGTPSRSSLSQAPGTEFLQSDPAARDAQHRNRSGSSDVDGSNGATKRVSADTSAPVTMESYYGPTHVHLAAIDNGLAFPFKHPDSWRSYPYGWLFLPRPLISQPFTKATRDHFLPLLSSPVWWREMIADLRRLFSIDSDFDQGMFDKQMAVMKGQGWNIVETLKNLDQGPMDLCRRVALVVWDEEVTLEPGASPLMPPLSSGQPYQGEGGGPQSYTSTQPRAVRMDATKAGYTHYGSIMSAGDRLSNSRTLSTSSTAIGEGAPLLKQDHVPSTRTSLPHMVINMEGEEGDQQGGDRMLQPKHDSFRQVVSDGEYDLDGDDYDDDDYEDDDDAFSFEEDYDDFEDSADTSPRAVATQTLAPMARDGMVSIDMALTNPEAPRSRRRRQSHHSESGVGVAGRPRRRQSSSGGVLVGEAEALANAAGTSASTLVVLPTQGRKTHRRSRTEQDHRTGTIRFDVASSESPGRSRRNTVDLESARPCDSLLPPSTQSSKFQRPEHPFSNASGFSANPFASPEDQLANESLKKSTQGVVGQEHQQLQNQQQDVVERGRGFFARGYGAISMSGRGDIEGGAGRPGELNERPKWADRLRRGLSLDAGLLVGGISQAARRERKLRKQRQRERELREKRVVLVERIEPVTKNLPYFTWW